jgi:hypothetical protein
VPFGDRTCGTLSLSLKTVTISVSVSLGNLKSRNCSGDPGKRG